MQVWLSVLLSALALTVPLSNPSTLSITPPPPPARESAVTVEVLDARGEPLRPGKTPVLSIAANGVPLPLTGVGPIPPDKPWRQVIWIDRVLSGSRTLRGAAGALAAQAPALVALGTVEIVVAEPEPQVVLAPTRDVQAVDEALSRLLLTGEGRDDLRALRQRFVDAVGAPTTEAAPSAQEILSRAEESLAAEVRLVSRQQDALVGWLATERTEGERPQALFLVSDGFDLDARALYLAKAGETARGDLQQALPKDALDAASLLAARTVAELGWTVISLPVGDERLPELRRRWGLGGPGGSPGVTIRPGRSKPEPPPPPPPVLFAPREPLDRMATASGGEVLLGGAEVAGALARLHSRFWLHYEAPAVSAATALEVKATDAGLRVKARRWDGPLSPEGVAAWRARQLLEEDVEPGDLEISATLGEGALEVILDPSDRPMTGGPPLRLTVALPAAGGAAAVSHHDIGAQELSADGKFRLPLMLPADIERLAVIVDDPARGLWGGRAVLVGGESADAESAAEDAAGVIVAEPGGHPAAERKPAGGQGTGVRIVQPATERGTGPVDVEVALHLPPQRRLDRLEIFWNDELQATLYGPPYRHRVLVPREHPVGTLRAEARLDDGSVAEDAMLLNGSAMGERLDVRLVELLVVVTDKAGRPVRSRGRGDFRLLQDGQEQSIATFDDAGDFPLTLGLAVDSSASMFIKLPGVVEAARSLLNGGLTPQDRALLVGYATEPRLLVAPTRNLRAVASGLDTLSADGGSNLFAALQYSLHQLQTVNGRKALLFYSDGIGEGEDGYGDCLRAARESHVPIYLIVTNANAVYAAKTGEPVGRYAERLEKLAAATGAKAYFVLPGQDLKSVYAEILRELRSQYLVAYYPKAGALDVWRKVAVEVKKPGLKARTLSGYYARK